MRLYGKQIFGHINIELVRNKSNRKGPNNYYDDPENKTNCYTIIWIHILAQVIELLAEQHQENTWKVKTRT